MSTARWVAAGYCLFFAAILPHGRPANAPLEELPLRFEKTLPLVSLVVNGSPLTFILDTASVDVAIDTRAAAGHGIAADTDGISTGSGGNVAVKIAHRVRLKHGRVEVIPDYVVLTSLEPLRFTTPIDGIAGLPLFRKYVVEIDYGAAVARIYAAGDYRPPADGHVFRAWLTHGPTVRGRLKLPGNAPLDADFQLDTGSAHVLTICKPFVDRHRMLAKVKTLEPGGTLGLGGGSPDMVGRIDSVAVGPYSISNPEVRFSTHATGSFATTLFSANLGNGFLNRYTVTFDLPHSRVIVAPRKARQ